MIEIAVTIKDDEHRFTHKQPLYDTITLSRDDPTLKALVDYTKAQLKAELQDEEIIVKTTMVW